MCQKDFCQEKFVYKIHKRIVCSKKIGGWSKQIRMGLTQGGGGGVDARPTQKLVGLKPQYHLTCNNKAYIPNFRPLEPYYTTIPGVGVGVGW